MRGSCSTLCSRRDDDAGKSRGGRRVVGDVSVTCQIWSRYFPDPEDTQNLLLSVPSSSNMLLTHSHFYYSDQLFKLSGNNSLVVDKHKQQPKRFWKILPKIQYSIQGVP